MPNPLTPDAPDQPRLVAPDLAAGPLDQSLPLAAGPCAACGGSARWNDAGVLRCTSCWPTPLTEAARTAEAKPLPPLPLRESPPAPAPVVGPRRPPFVCPKCEKPSTWLIRGQAWVCSRCEHRLSQPQEEAA